MGVALACNTSSPAVCRVHSQRYHLYGSCQLSCAKNSHVGLSTVIYPLLHQIVVAQSSTSSGTRLVTCYMSNPTHNIIYVLHIVAAVTRLRPYSLACAVCRQHAVCAANTPAASVDTLQRPLTTSSSLACRGRVSLHALLLGCCCYFYIRQPYGLAMDCKRVACAAAGHKQVALQSQPLLAMGHSITSAAARLHAPVCIHASRLLAAAGQPLQVADETPNPVLNPQPLVESNHQCENVA
jgi:hypothetical protein